MSANFRFHAAPATVISLAVALGLAVAGVLTLSGAKAASPQVKCGDRITADATLHKDLVNCPNNGIVIGADDVTLDLNGHTIDGDAAPAAGCNGRKEFCDTGIVNFRHNGVAVLHGSIRQFDAGVNFGEVGHNRLLGISASRNRFIGIQLFKASRSLVKNSSGKGSTFREGNGIGVFDSRRLRILNSTFRHNGEAGIHVGDTSKSLIKGNLLSRNGAFGIILEGSDRNQVRRNRSVRDGAIGIYVAPGNRNVIARNHVSRTRAHRAGEGTAIEVDGGDRNVFARNSIRRTQGNAIGVGFDVVVGNVVRRNHISGAGKDGVHVIAKAKHTLLRRNRVRRSKDDGIDVAGARSKLTRNRAVRNGDLGIEAVRGVTDGGGNVARHNGDPRQCTHIRCG